MDVTITKVYSSQDTMKTRSINQIDFSGNNRDFDDIFTEKTFIGNDINISFNDIYSKLCNTLIERGRFPSFKETKNMDRIEMGSNVREMFKLINPIYERNISSFDYHIPFIKEGVIKGYDVRGTIYVLFHIMGLNYENHIIKLGLEAYKFISSPARFVHLVDYEIQHTFHADSIELDIMNIHIGFDWFDNDCDVESILSQREFAFYKLVRDEQKTELEELSNDIFHIAQDQEFYDKDFNVVDFVYELAIKGIVATNMMIEKQRNQVPCVNESNNTIQKIPRENSSISINIDNTPHKRKEVTIDGITIKKGAKSKIKLSRSGMIMNRHADVWGVIGHWRHYKNGKKIYIEPYKKGPKRLTKDPDPKTYKVKDIESGN